MNNYEMVQRMVNNQIAEMNDIIDCLYVTSETYAKNKLLNRLRRQISNIELLMQSLHSDVRTGYPEGAPPRQNGAPRPTAPAAPPAPTTPPTPTTPTTPTTPVEPTPEERIFTPAELARYTGRDGNPAYVAVNGIVYDVSNNPTWAGATHFGLTAGRDLTNEFVACHAGQPVFYNLQVIGKMA